MRGGGGRWGFPGLGGDLTTVREEEGKRRRGRGGEEEEERKRRRGRGEGERGGRTAEEII